MLSKHRNATLSLLLLFIIINATYFTENLSSRGLDFYRRVKVKISVVVDSAVSDKPGWAFWNSSDEETVDGPGVEPGSEEEVDRNREEVEEASVESLPVYEEVAEAKDINSLFVDEKPTDLSLRQLCAQTQWTPNLYLACHNRCGENKTSICGGLNNARNRLQTCLRLAIDAGATLILPSATTRNEDVDVERGLRGTNGGGTVGADVFWDVDGLRSALGGEGVCPQLGLRNWDDYPVVANGREIVLPFRNYRRPPLSKGKFRSLVDKGLKNKGIKRIEISEEEPVLVVYGDSFVSWDYKESSEMDGVRRGLFSSLGFNKDLLALGESVLRSPELEDGFIGVHFRGESDWPREFGGKGLQMKLYIQEIRKINQDQKDDEQVKAIYVSCGSQDAITSFRKKLHKDLGEEYKVFDKWMLLKSRPKLLERVANMAFDQKAIVEYKTLVEGKYFLGIVSSTMSCLIAFTRTVDDLGGVEGADGNMEHEGEGKIESKSESNKDFFEDEVFEGSVRRRGRRVWRGGPGMKGEGNTRLLVVDGRDIMRNFP